jgi:hypothetical protein
MRIALIHKNVKRGVAKHRSNSTVRFARGILLAVAATFLFPWAASIPYFEHQG